MTFDVSFQRMDYSDERELTNLSPDQVLHEIRSHPWSQLGKEYTAAFEADPNADVCFPTAYVSGDPDVQLQMFTDAPDAFHFFVRAHSRHGFLGLFSYRREHEIMRHATALEAAMALVEKFVSTDGETLATEIRDDRF